MKCEIRKDLPVNIDRRLFARDLVILCTALSSFEKSYAEDGCQPVARLTEGTRDGVRLVLRMVSKGARVGAIIDSL